jgi:chloride channel 3/4/5
MTTDVIALPASGLTLAEVDEILDSNKYQGYPIVEDRTSRTLLGYIGRTELRYAIDRARRENLIVPHAQCFFTPSTARPTTTLSATVPAVSFDTMAATAGQMSVDFSRFIDPTPLSVHPRLPLETVMELFKKIGPRVILIDYRGKLTGLVTVKDCLKYQFKVEAQEHPKDDSGVEEGEERLWEGISKIASWFGRKASVIGKGRLRLGDTPNHYRDSTSSGASPRRGQVVTSDDGSIDAELELVDRPG